MPSIAILCGLLLAAVSAVSHFQPETLGTVPAVDSPTKWIPAGFGAVLILSGLISLAAPHLRKHAMHLAAVAGLLGVLGGLAMPLVNVIKGTLDMNTAPFHAQVMMTLISAVFLYLCIRSFVAVRKAREAAALTSPSAGTP